MSLEESVSKMIECLRTAEKEAMDPPAPGVQVSHRVKGRVGRPHVEIDRNFLGSALQVGGPYKLAKVMKCHPRTIRRQAIEYGLSDPVPPVFRIDQNPNGTVSQTWLSSSTPARSTVADDPNTLDGLVRTVLHTVTTHGLNVMHSGHVGPPGIISFTYLSFHSTPTPVLLVRYISIPFSTYPMPNPFAQILYTRYPSPYRTRI